MSGHERAVQGNGAAGGKAQSKQPSPGDLVREQGEADADPAGATDEDSRDPTQPT
jgi:hypothetical protein